MPAASSHIVNSSNTPSIPVQTLVASKALIQQEHDKSFQSQVSNNKNGSLNQQESSSAHADLIHAARIRNCDTGQSPHRVIASTIRNSSPIAIPPAVASNIRKPPTPPPRLTSIRTHMHKFMATPAHATNTLADTTTHVEIAPCNHGTRSLPRDLSSERSYIGDWGTKYQALSTGDLPETRTPQQKLSSERLEYELSRVNLYSAEQYNARFSNSQSWLHSVSCRNLYDSSFEESGRTKRRATDGFITELLSVDRIDSPITRYDDSRKVLYGSRMTTSLDIDRDFVFLNQKVYSSSYPGTSANSAYEPFGCPFELSISHDDISHDSYEVLEKSIQDHFYHIKRSKSDHGYARSCSLDSGNYIPSDDSVSDVDCKYRSGVEIKSRSVNDMQLDAFSSVDDPRYLPREKMSVRSDGNFYREIQRALSSRTSSQDSCSDIYNSKHCKSSQDSSKKSHDSVYHTDSKKSRETLKSKSSDRSGYNSRDSSQESKSGSYELDHIKNAINNIVGEKSRTSSQESKSDYFDARMTPTELDNVDLIVSDEFNYNYDNFKQKMKSHDSLLSEMKSTAKSQFYDSNSTYSTIPSSNKNKETSHVHSITLQNVETEQHMRAHFYKKNISGKPKNTETKTTSTIHIWPENIAGMHKEITEIHKDRYPTHHTCTQNGENIFSFDKDKIESLTSIENKLNDYNIPDVVKIENPISTTVLPSEFDKQKDSPSIINSKKDTRKEELMAKTHFDEYNPKLILDSQISQAAMLPLIHTHATVERTKSDPNNLANRSRIGSNSRRHMLMHQKSIDLTPADSSDEDYIYRQIPSAPPVCKTHGHFDLPKIPYESLPDKRAANFELPKSYFKNFDDRKYVRDSSRRDCFQNDLNRAEIPYILHKRHVMNGTAPTPLDFTMKQKTKPRSPKSPKSPSGKDARKNALPKAEERNNRDVINHRNDIPGFLFTQNIDLSKVDPVTLEVTKNLAPTQFITSPKRDITENMDPLLLETLNSKLSQIESDSATSSKTESLHPGISKYLSKGEGRSKISDYSASKLLNINNKNDTKGNKRIIKARMQPHKKNVKNKNKQKMRITSFSSDDESLDSDDVFGSTEATPTRLEFSPPQSRKDMEPILQAEYDKITSGIWHRGQTMSSTEIEGSPPQCRRLVELENRYNSPSLEPLQVYAGTELRRISERSISIPSSEDDYVPGHRQNGETFVDQSYHEKIPSPILESCEFLHIDNEIYETCPEEGNEEFDIPYTLVTKSKPKETIIPKPVESIEQPKIIVNKMPSRTKLIEELTELPRKGHTAILFAHARLNLSEGSAFASLQRQKATQESPNTGRRAKSLDNPVISLHRLPPMNAFSSKDDTFDFNEEGELLEEKSIEDNESQEYNLVTNELEIPVDPVLESITLDDGEIELLEKLKLIKHVRPNFVIKTKSGKGAKGHKERDWIIKSPSKKNDSEKSPSKQKSPQKLKLITQQSLPIIKTNKKVSPKSKSKKVISDQKILPSAAKSFDSGSLRSKSPSQLNVPDSVFVTDNSKKCSESDVARKPKSLDLNQVRRPKDLSRSIEKLEIKKTNSKERSKSQEESDADIEKRKEKQQQLYESAMKQTIISPVKDIPPAFPAPEDKISVKTDGEKIIIETDIKSKPEDHVFIAKSPKKLESTLTKASKSFEDTKQIDKIPKLNRSFDDRSSPSFEDKEKFEIAILQQSPGKISISRELKKKIEGTVVHKSVATKSKSLEQHDTYCCSVSQKSKSLEDHQSIKSPGNDCNNAEQKSKTHTRKKIRQTQTENESCTQEFQAHYNVVLKNNQPDSSETDTQAVIAERRKLDLMKRQSLKAEEEPDVNNGNNLEQKPSEDESLTEVSDIKAEVNSDDSSLFVINKSDVCDTENDTPQVNSKLLKVDHIETLRKLSIERSRSEDTGSWITVDYEECIGGDDFLISDNEEEAHMKGEAECSGATSNDTIEIEDFYKNIIITPPQDVSPIIEAVTFPEITKEEIESNDLHSVDIHSSKNHFRKMNIERSKSSETSGSWTSGEKDISPLHDGFLDRQDSSPCSSKDKGSLDDESSISCTISRPFGISQDLDKFDMLDKMKCNQLREHMLEIDEVTLKERNQKTLLINKIKPNPLELPALDLPIQSERRLSTPTLEKQFTIDIEAGSELENDFMLSHTNYLDKLSKPEESESSSSSSQLKNQSAIHVTFSKPMISNPKIELTLSTDTNPESERLNSKRNIYEKLNICKDKKHSLESRSSLESKASLSVESRGSFETESSSGSLGAAQRKGELAQKEQQSTWKPFNMDSSGSSSLEEGWLPAEADNATHESFDLSSQTSCDKFQLNNIKDTDEKVSGLNLPDSSTNFCSSSLNTTTNASTLNVGSSEVMVGYSSTFALARTLSRISERSTTSEKSSIDEDSTKASSHSESIRDESIVSSDHHASLSSDPSNTNLAYISDTDRRTSAEMPDIPCDPGHSDRLNQLYASAQNALSQQSVQTGRFSVTQVDEPSSPCTEDDVKSKLMKSTGSSQDSEDWPLPEIPKDADEVYLEQEEADDQFEVHGAKEKPILKAFNWRNNSIRSQESDIWPSPPSSALDAPIVENVEAFYVERPGSVLQVTVDSFTEHVSDDHSRDSDVNEDITYDDHSTGISKDSDVSAVSPCTELKISTSPIISKVLPYEEASYFMPKDDHNIQSFSEQNSSCLGATLSSATCFKSTFTTTICCSSGNNISQQYTLDSGDKVIVAQPTKSQNQSPLLEEIIDDVFHPGTVKIEISLDSGDGDRRNQSVKFSHGSNNSDTSTDDIFTPFTEENVLRTRESCSSTGSCKKYSHSSHSEEETSSFGTDIDGTVKMGLQPKKCTHSSHSEDTSIGLSISEWSTGTNTVRQYTNLSASESISGNKSEKSSGNITSSILSSSGFKSSESLSGSKSRLSIENLPEDIRYDPLTNSDTTELISSGTKSDDTTSTLTEIVHTLSEWSSSTTDTLVPFDDPNLLTDNFSKYLPMDDSISDKLEIRYEKLTTLEKLKKNQISLDIPSEEVAKKKIYDSTEDFDNKETKSTERPVKIPLDAREKPPLSKKPLDKIVKYNTKHETNNIFNEMLYSEQNNANSKCQSQELVHKFNIKSASVDNSVTFSRVVETCEKPLIKHHSYDDKTLSKNQIREYQNAKSISKSHSFHEHMICQKEPIQKNISLSKDSSSACSSIMPDRPGRLSKNSSYYSSSLSSESPPIQVMNPIAKPPRKTVMPRNFLPKSPPSGNDTDSSLDFIQQKTRDPVRRGYRRRRQPPPRRRAERISTTNRREMESSEEYFPEIESGSSDFADRLQYPDFDEEQEVDNDYQQKEYYPNYNNGGFEELDMSTSNVDEMGFPRYDRLRSLGYAKLDAKPPRSSKKRQYKREDSVAVGSGYPHIEYTSDAQGAGLSDDLCGSSEDSFSHHFAPGAARDSYFASNIECSGLDSSEPFDLSSLPPPLFNPNDNDEFSDEFQ